MGEFNRAHVFSLVVTNREITNLDELVLKVDQNSATLWRPEQKSSSILLTASALRGGWQCCNLASDDRLTAREDTIRSFAEKRNPVEEMTFVTPFFA
jgi:hypothetical protein